MNVSIVGTGYVGLTTGALLAAAGNKVYCIDVDERKLEIIKSGKSYFYEPGLDLFVEQAIKSGNLIPTSSYEEAIPNSDFAIISVGTPSRADGSMNMEYVFAAAESIAKNMKDGMIIMQKSTVPVGTGRKIEKIVEKNKKTAYVLSCPEFLAEGSAVFDTLNMDRFVVGGDSASAKKKAVELFQSLDELSKKIEMDNLAEFTQIYRGKSKLANVVPFKDRVLSMKLESAELVKMTANAFLAMKISYANLIARVADKVGADINEVMEGIGKDDRIGRAFLYAGLGWGGGCFPKDVSELAHFTQERDVDAAILDATIEINEAQADYVLTKIEKMLDGELKGRAVTVLGLSFKPGTSDIRFSPAIKLIELLVDLGAKVKVYDPQAMDEIKEELQGKVLFSKDIEDALEETECAILTTDWPEFVNLDFSKYVKLFRSKNLVDGRNKWSKNDVEKLGFNYNGVGR